MYGLHKKLQRIVRSVSLYDAIHVRAALHVDERFIKHWSGCCLSTWFGQTTLIRASDMGRHDDPCHIVFGGQFDGLRVS